MKKKLIILDIDETLIFSTENLLEYEPDFSFGQFHTYKRPFLKEFLEFCFENFEVAVWTSATESYAAEIINQIFSKDQHLSFFWTRSRCTISYDEELRESIHTKKMWKIRRKGYDLKHVIVIDDSPEQWKSSYGNLVRVEKFLGQKDDKELKLLIEYLKKLKDAENIRAIGKRGWRYSIES